MTQKDTVTVGYPEHVAECARRWEKALEAEGFDGAVIHAGSLITAFLDDYRYPFRPNPHFLSWLPLTRHHDSVLLFRPGERPLLYYYQPDDYWYLPPSDPEEWWADEFDVRPVRDNTEWRHAAGNGEVAYIGDAPALADAGNLNPARLINRLHLERARKTAYEIECISAANRLAARGHEEATAAFREGHGEYEIHQRYCRAAGLLDEELPYGSIVALNQSGAVLHYQRRLREPPDRVHSLLIDAGATIQGYAADITRTHVAGEGGFRAVVEAMDAMQQEMCGRMLAGCDYRDLHLEAHLRIARILGEFELITVAPETAVESGLSAVFFPHGLGHFLGLQTHDVAGMFADADGAEIARPEGHPFLRLTRVLEPGNVLTVEPGLYFIDSLLRQWRDRGEASAVNWERVREWSVYGGIRIEDNVVVTSGAPRNLSRDAFAALEREP